KQSSGQKNPTHDRTCPKLAPDTRTCCIRTNTFGPWLIDLIILAASASLTSSSCLGHFPTAASVSEYARRRPWTSALRNAGVLARELQHVSAPWQNVEMCIPCDQSPIFSFALCA